MKWLAIILTTIAILMLTGILLVTIKLHEKREILEMTPIQVYETLLGDQTAASVARSLSKPSVGNVGTFGGYDWPDSKVSGVGGSLRVNNPTILSMIPSGKYIPQSNEGRPSIVGLT